MNISPLDTLTTKPMDPLLRMAVFCTFLLGAMKALVYVEWAATGRRLTWGRYLIFSFLWFGMEPGTFARRRMGLEWRSHLRIGMMCASAGLLGALIVRSAGWPALATLGDWHCGTGDRN